MESISTVFFGSPPLPKQIKTRKPFTPKPVHSHLKSLPISLPLNSQTTHFKSSLNCLSESPPLFQNLAKTILIATITTAATFHNTLPCFASESVVDSSAEQVSSGKINIEAILVSIDNFFTKYPFFVGGCAFIWLVVTPIAQYYLSKCKYIYTIDAFKKLQDDPTAQLLDIRESKTVKYLKPPNLKILSKTTVHVEYSEADTDGFLKRVLENFSDPGNTVVCILDDLDGNSMAVAELLFKNGFKEAYAIKGGVAGKKGWWETQEYLLPASTHIYTKKKFKKSKQDNNTPAAGEIQETNKGDETPESKMSTLDRKISARSSSPYPNYPDLKPPASPTPSKPSK